MRTAFPYALILAAIALAPFLTPARSSQPAAPPKAAAPAVPAQQPKPATSSPAGNGLLAVVLDPAHGGSDSGARGPTGAAESDIVLDFARAIRVALEAQGLRVLLTREGNQDPSFDDRSTLINGLPNAVFVSLHVSSTGPLGTVRAYSFLFPAAGRPASATSHPGLLPWDRAQFPYVASSRQLAELLQVQLAQKFHGSPEVPLTAAARQLRTVAAPAVAIEVSSVAAADSQRLAQMGQPLAEAVARAIADYRPLAPAPSAASGGGR